MEVSKVGSLPTKPAPTAGEGLTLELPGAPPTKTYGRSMRNETSPQRNLFLALRRAAIEAMDGRKWYEGNVELRLTYWCSESVRIGPWDYISGVMDTLGGSHGPSFIYLPIAYLDDCQCSIGSVQRKNTEDGARYILEVHFL
jgi:hypothetical protein